MPDWEPDWTDVRFDHVAASEAAAACRAAAARLDALLASRVVAASEAAVEWRGRFADDFHRTLAGQRWWAEHLSAALLRQAARIDAASAIATEQQRDRVRARERWREEAAAETVDR